MLILELLLMYKYPESRISSSAQGLRDVSAILTGKVL